MKCVDASVFVSMYIRVHDHIHSAFIYACMNEHSAYTAIVHHTYITPDNTTQNRCGKKKNITPFMATLYILRIVTPLYWQFNNFTLCVSGLSRPVFDVTN